MATRREHRMEFGCRLLQAGGVSFRLWAPAAATVDLCLLEEENRLQIPMERRPEGWFELETAAAGRGSRYCFQLESGLLVPDPASRFQPDGVHGPSQVIGPADFSWPDVAWQGRPWQEAVIYELHVGSFTPAGTFKAAAARLDYLVDLGVTAIELMPVAAFPGRCSWGYDGVLPFAPAGVYGRPEELKGLIAAAHARGLMVLLDVVYNHFGPEGNYLHAYAPQFFTDRCQTPWGAALDFDGPESLWVRRFFIDNALYWLSEFHLDGLRLDAVHAIFDRSRPNILEELATEVRSRLPEKRHLHLVLENDANEARYLGRNPDNTATLYNAQWNEDLHHALHVLLTGETDGYYRDYASRPASHLGRCLAEGFAYQGEASPYRNQEPRGEPSRTLPSCAFVNFLQNHDQIGNRALGERLSQLAEPAALRAALAVLLLAPSPPLLFMGEEWGSHQPFTFFCDFEEKLNEQVREGRRLEFAGFPAFSDPQSRALIPDPTAAATFEAARLDWQECDSPDGAAWLDYYRRLLGLRHRQIIPRLGALAAGENHWRSFGETGLTVRWPMQTGESLQLFANLGSQTVTADGLPPLPPLFASQPQPRSDELPPWSVYWYLAPPPAGGEGP